MAITGWPQNHSKLFMVNGKTNNQDMKTSGFTVPNYVGKKTTGVVTPTWFIGDEHDGMGRDIAISGELY